jgi:transcriptional regulator with PAS, ATPase and Fis domain
MAGVLSLVNRIAPTDATVLILGETGVGKDVVARLVHSRSPRHEKLMLKVDCGGISETLTESEIFGYVGGAFTGASSKGKAGYFEIANESTVFLDEIGELPLSMQTRLLRVLQDGEIVRVGSSQPRKVNVRVIAATNKNLRDCVEAGTFRRDLYYRLNVAVIQIPPLRERSEDIAPLARMFLEEYAAKYHKKLRFMDITLEMMRGYSWPGNVRELQNLVHSMAITATGEAVSPQDLPPQISGPSPLNKRFLNDIYAGHRTFKEIMGEAEADFLRRAIEMYGSVQKVAQVFKLDRSTIFRKLKAASRH